MRHLFRKITCILLVVLLILCVCTGCNRAGDDSSVTGEPALNGTDEVLTIGSVFYLNLENSKGAVNDWHIADGSGCISINQTSNNSVEVKAIAEGTAVIHCEFEDGERTIGLTCKITVVPAYFSVSPSSVFMHYGESMTLGVAPAFSASLSWSSSDTDVCVVDQYGKITSVGVGSATVTACLTQKPEINASAQVNVVEANFVNGNMTMVPSQLEAQVGSTVPLSASGGTGTFTWKTSDKSKATVTDGGIVTLLSTGTVTITATDTAGTSATCKITVYMAPTEIKVSPQTAQLTKGKSVQLSASVSPSKANKTVTWYSSDPAIATVSDTGKVTMVGEGTVTITAQSVYNSVKGTATITTGTPVSGITADRTTLTVGVGETFTAGAAVTPKNAAITKYSISISDTKIVKQNGNDNKSFVAVAPGTATITYTSAEGGYTAKCVVTVTNDIKSATISPDIGNVSVGETIQLTIKTNPEGADASGEWKIADNSIATVDQNGVVTGVGAGSTSVSFTFKNGNLTVASVIKVVEEVTISQTEATLNIGEKKKLTVSIGSADVEGTWSSGQSDVATVSDTGEVTAVAYGTANITFTPSNKEYSAVTCKVTVCEEASSVKLSDTLVYLKTGDSATFTAEILPETATQSGKWEVTSGTDVGTVDENGEFTALKDGHAVVTYTVTDKVSGSIDIFVGDRATGVLFEENSYSVEVGKTVSTVQVFTPATTVNRTGTFTVSDKLIAEVDKNGTVTGKSAGTTTLTFVSQDGEYRASCDIVVTQGNSHTVIVKYDKTFLGAGNILQADLKEYEFEADVAPTESGVTYSFEDVNHLDTLKLTPDGNKCKFQATADLETQILVTAKLGEDSFSTSFTLRIVSTSPSPSVTANP